MLSEYLLIIWLNIKSFYAKSASNWQQGDKGNVVLIPGYAENYFFLEKIGNLFNRLGYKIWIVPKFNSIGGILSETKRVAEFIAQHNLQNVILVGHSRGGIIAKILIDSYKNMNIRVKKVFALAVPWQGTLFGYLQFLNLFELVPNSALINKLLADKTNLHKIVNIYPRLDNHVLPNRHLILNGAENRQINVVGHTRILECSATLECLTDLLAK